MKGNEKENGAMEFLFAVKQWDKQQDRKEY